MDLLTPAGWKSVKQDMTFNYLEADGKLVNKQKSKHWEFVKVENVLE